MDGPGGGDDGRAGLRPLSLDDAEAIEVRFVSSARLHLVRPRTPAAGPAPLLLLLHGYAQDPEVLLRFAEGIVPPGVALALPEAPNAFARRGATPRHGVVHDWIVRRPRGPEDRRNTAYLLAALDAVRHRTRVDPARTVVLGYSQGAGVAFHLATERPDAVSAVVSLAGGFAADYRPRLCALRGKDVLFVGGHSDASYPPAYQDELCREISDAGVALTRETLDAGHALLEPAAPLVARWLAPRLAPSP